MLGVYPLGPTERKAESRIVDNRPLEVTLVPIYHCLGGGDDGHKRRAAGRGTRPDRSPDGKAAGQDPEGTCRADWLRPFHDLGTDTVTLRHTGGTDHLPFDSIGLPGFQFIQDEMDYTARTHHSNMDTYDHLEREDLMQASVLMAAFLYDAAMRPEMMPRKPLPE